MPWYSAYFNNVTYINQKVPTLYTAATTGEFNTNPIVYGEVNPFIVNYGDLVQIVVNNVDAAAHPFHLHGHHFQVLDRPRSGTGNWPHRDVNYASTPVKRDTVTVMANSFAVLRFRADNPGTWLFHCHIEWHVEMGLTATIIEAPECLEGLTFPADHIAACQKAGIPYQGNAAGNTQNPLDTTGFITVPPTDYTGLVLLCLLSLSLSQTGTNQSRSPQSQLCCPSQRPPPASCSKVNVVNWMIRTWTTR